MNNVILYSDLHITQSSLKECILILEEIGMLANKYNCDTLINIGDTFDSLKPTSAELDIFATFIRRLGNNKKHIIIAADSHESETQTVSIINHFGILNEMVTVVKEYKDSNHLYCGHFSIKESSSNYDAKLSKEDFKKYLYVFLGHVHSYQLIKPNIVHLGSCRYVNFDEAKDKQKIVALITDYGTEKENTHFLKLKSPIPMIQLELQKDALLGGSKATSEAKIIVPGAPSEEIHASESSISAVCQKLDKMTPNTKVKVKILDFESFRQFLPFCNKYSSKFEVFKYETSFEIISVNNQKNIQTEMTSFKQSILKWIEQQNLDTKVKEILLKEIE
jgi:DNA repair exonuclease SbcCD nuclease subunit